MLFRSNDITEMGRMHRRAAALLHRPAISIHSTGGWTFNSPSVLMIYHREAGLLDQELREMDRCMPCYCKAARRMRSSGKLPRWGPR